MIESVYNTKFYIQSNLYRKEIIIMTIDERLAALRRHFEKILHMHNYEDDKEQVAYERELDYFFQIMKDLFDSAHEI